MTTIKTLFNRKWWWVTLVVILGVIFLVRLGIWQVERLDQRRAFNASVAERWRQEPFDLNQTDLPANLSELEYRRVQVAGTFDYDNQIVLTNQPRGNAPGVILVTPLVMDGDRAVLVARGWVPYNQTTEASLDTFNEDAATPLIGLIQESQTLPGGKPVTVPDTAQQEWFYLNIDAIQPQMPYELAPIFVLQLPEDGRPLDQLPFREEPLVLTDGNHLSYAIQWIMFAVILGFGYIQYVRYTEQRAIRIAAAQAEMAAAASDMGEHDAEVDLPSVAHQT